jgi:hypothetical protein
VPCFLSSNVLRRYRRSFRLLVWQPTADKNFNPKTNNGKKFILARALLDENNVFHPKLLIGE